MWNVFGYCKQYINNEVNNEDFINIYDSQHQLRDFINDMQLELDKNKDALQIISDFRIKQDFKSLKIYIEELVNGFETKHNK